MRRAIEVIVWSVLVGLIVVILVSAGIRVATDAPLIATGVQGEAGSFEQRYVAHPWLAYLHIVPGVLYLVGAPMQLRRRFRERHFTFHRRFGRVLLGLGLLSGVFALVFGVLLPFGGTWESFATVVFGSWFLVALLLAFRAIRRGNVRMHRRWMIRAFAVGLGVGSIRVWIGIFVGARLLSLESSFAPAFWIGLTLHVLAAEGWLWWRPGEDGLPRNSRSPRVAGAPVS